MKRPLLSNGATNSPENSDNNAASEDSGDILAQAEQQVASQLTADTRANYDKIVVAGMRIGLQGGPQSILASLRRSQDPIADCAKGAVALVMILRHQSQGVMPIRAMVPAAMTLMLKALQFADKAGIVKVGSDELVRATHIFTDALFQAMHISKQMLARYGEQVSQMVADPATLEKIKMKAGFVSHPGVANVPA